MSGVLSSFQQRAPGAFTSPAPRCWPGCQTMKKAPCGSWMTAIRPASMTSNGGAWTVAPSSPARSAAWSALSTHT